MSRIGVSKKLFDPVVEVLESSELQEAMSRIDVAAGFGRSPIDAEIATVGNVIPCTLNAKALEKFWNFNQTKIAEMFLYNPVVRHPELSHPDEERIDATAFSIMLAGVIESGDDITLMTPRAGVGTRPLVDNLCAYIPAGRVTLTGQTGDGIAHHAGAKSRIVLQGPTGDNLGFGSDKDAMIYAATIVGENPSSNVSGPIPELAHLHR